MNFLYKAYGFLRMCSKRGRFCSYLRIHGMSEISLENKDENMLHKLSLDANSMAISYWQVYRCNRCL